MGGVLKEVVEHHLGVGGRLDVLVGDPLEDTLNALVGKFLATSYLRRGFPVILGVELDAEDVPVAERLDRVVVLREQVGVGREPDDLVSNSSVPWSGKTTVGTTDVDGSSATASIPVTTRSGSL